MSNKKGPWQLASADGGMASMTRVTASFPATGLTTEEIGLRFAHASGGIALCRAAGLIDFISGSHSAVVGLPLFETRALLKAAGLSLD